MGHTLIEANDLDRPNGQYGSLYASNLNQLYSSLTSSLSKFVLIEVFLPVIVKPNFKSPFKKKKTSSN